MKPDFPVLTTLVVLPAIGAALVLAVPRRRPELVKVIGLVFNAVRPTTLDYYYYKYQEYYAAYPTASTKRAKA